MQINSQVTHMIIRVYILPYNLVRMRGEAHPSLRQMMYK